MDALPNIPPLAGCLYCHGEGTTTLLAPRWYSWPGSRFPLVKCTECQSVAQIDCDPEDPDRWRIRFRQVNHDARFYYVHHHLGKAGWLSGDEALAISTRGYVQRQRVQQARRGDLDWLQPAPLNPPLPLMTPGEVVYLTLKGVTYQEAPPVGFLVRPDQGGILDSGKFYVTGQKLYLVGQRRDWSHDLAQVDDVLYDDVAWRVLVAAGDQVHQYRGTNLTNQWDAQLIAATVNTLRLRAVSG